MDGTAARADTVLYGAVWPCGGRQAVRRPRRGGVGAGSARAWCAALPEEGLREAGRPRAGQRGGAAASRAARPPPRPAASCQRLSSAAVPGDRLPFPVPKVLPLSNYTVHACAEGLAPPPAGRAGRTGPGHRVRPPTGRGRTRGCPRAVAITEGRAVPPACEQCSPSRCPRSRAAVRLSGDARRHVPALSPLAVAVPRVTAPGAAGRGLAASGGSCHASDPCISVLQGQTVVDSTLPRSLDPTAVMRLRRPRPRPTSRGTGARWSLLAGRLATLHVCFAVRGLFP